MIPVIDIFAGPGGLGEGFSAFRRGRRREFKIVLSIEKDEFAHQTLQLRSLFRQFTDDAAPEPFYKFVRGEISKQELFKRLSEAAARAEHEAWRAELGKTPAMVIDCRSYVHCSWLSVISKASMVPGAGLRGFISSRAYPSLAFFCLLSQ